MKSLNIIFAGTPDFAVQHLQAILNSQHNVIAVYTQPDKPAGRGKNCKQVLSSNLLSKITFRLST